MSNNQRESLEDRLNRRRRLRNKRFLGNDSVDESAITVINHSLTTQSLDRESSKRITPISSSTSPVTSTPSTDQRKPSSTITKNPELPPIEKSYSNQNYRLVNDKSNSTPLLPQVTKHQSLESENEKQTSSKSHSRNEQQQQKYPYQDEKPAIIKETVLPLTSTENSNTIQQETHTHHDEKPVVIKETVTSTLSSIIPPKTNENFKPIQQETHTHQDEKPVIIKETVTSTLSSIIPPKTNENFKPTQQEIDEKPVIIKETVASILPPSRIIETCNPIPRETSLPNRIKNFSESSAWDHPSSHPQLTTDSQQKDFNFRPFHLKSIARTSSEQIVSITKHKHQLIDPKFTKKNSLALSYLFNRRMIDAELARASSLDSEQSQPKTVWD